MFAKLIVGSNSFQKASQVAGMRVRRWLQREFSDFRKEIHASYLIDAAYGTLHISVLAIKEDIFLMYIHDKLLRRVCAYS